MYTISNNTPLITATYLRSNKSIIKSYLNFQNVNKFDATSIGLLSIAKINSGIRDSPFAKGDFLDDLFN